MIQCNLNSQLNLHSVVMWNDWNQKFVNASFRTCAVFLIGITLGLALRTYSRATQYSKYENQLYFHRISNHKLIIRALKTVKLLLNFNQNHSIPWHWQRNLFTYGALYCSNYFVETFILKIDWRNSRRRFQRDGLHLILSSYKVHLLFLKMHLTSHSTVY